MNYKDIMINTDKDIIWITRYEFGEWAIQVQQVGSDFVENNMNKNGYEIWLTNKRYHNLKIKLDKRIQYEDEINDYVMDLINTKRISAYINAFIKLSGGQNLKDYKETVEE